MQGSSKDRVRLLHIWEAIEKIEQYILDKNYNNFVSDSMVNDACIRQLVIIGEASNSLSNNIKELSRETEWRQVIGLRNFLVHQYFGVDSKIVWDIIQYNLPELKLNIEKLLQDL